MFSITTFASMKSIRSLNVILFFMASILLLSFHPGQDKKAEAILKNVATKYKSFKTYRADFKYNLENKKDKINLNKKGTLWVKGNKFRLAMGDREIFCDGKTSWTYNEGDNEVEINNYDPKSAEVTPSKIFTIYEKGFSSQFVEEKIEGSRILQIVDLTPTDKKKPYYKVKLFIDKGSSQMVRTKIFDKNANVYTYEILKFAVNIKIKDTFFNFDEKLHPGVTRNDLR